METEILKTIPVLPVPTWKGISHGTKKKQRRGFEGIISFHNVTD